MAQHSAWEATKQEAQSALHGFQDAYWNVFMGYGGRKGDVATTIAQGAYDAQPFGSSKSMKDIGTYGNLPSAEAAYLPPQDVLPPLGSYEQYSYTPQEYGLISNTTIDAEYTDISDTLHIGVNDNMEPEV